MSHSADFAPAYDSINDIKAYQTGKPISELARELGIDENNIVKLASNENPLGCSPKAITAMQHELAEPSRYPDGAGYYLKQAIIKHHGGTELTLSNITLGNGSNDILDMITRTFAGNQHSTVFSQYAFAVYWLASKAVGAQTIIVDAKNYAHDLPAMASAIQDNTKIVFLANPNNPTGTYFQYDELVAFLESVPSSVLVVLDEAYVEYFEADEYLDSIDLLPQYSNLIITRTFSKAYGLASVRVGYALSHAGITDMLNRIRQPFNVNSMAQAAAVAALADIEFVNKSRKLNNDQKQRLEQALTQMDIRYIPSKTNFVAIDVSSYINTMDSKDIAPENAGQLVYEALLKEGVITRPLAGYGMAQWLRVSIGLPEENTKFLNALEKIMVSTQH